MPGSRRRYLFALALVVFAGIVSRVFRTGLVLVDKYLGDALYAIMLYLLLRLARPNASPAVHAAVAMALMLAIEAFQLTGIPLAFAHSPNVLLRVAAVALGTGFSWRDIAAYVVGIVGVWLLDALGMGYRGSGIGDRGSGVG